MSLDLHFDEELKEKIRSLLGVRSAAWRHCIKSKQFNVNLSLSVYATFFKVIQGPIEHHASHNEYDHEPGYHIQSSITCIMY